MYSQKCIFIDNFQVFVLVQIAGETDKTQVFGNSYLSVKDLQFTCLLDLQKSYVKGHPVPVLS